MTTKTENIATALIEAAAEIGQTVCKKDGHINGPILVGFKARIVCKRCGQVANPIKKVVLK